MRNLLILFTLITIIFSCKKEENLNFSGNLNFSNDTILFDTIFSSIGSTTKTLTIYNNQNQNVVTNIELKGSSSANFRINVDGVSGDMHKDIIIPSW